MCLDVAKFYHFGNIFDGSSSIWPNYKPTLANILFDWANISVKNGQIL